MLVDCEWSEFMVGECSATCGEGTLEKHRFELVPAMFGGVPCEGDALVVESCNNGDCPGKRLHLGFPHLSIKLIEVAKMSLNTSL